MIRSALIIVSIFCVATLFSEALGFAFLWFRGQLNGETLHEIRLVLSGGNPDEFADGDEGVKVRPSVDDILRHRSLRVLELDAREGELALMKTMITQKADELISEQQAFEERKLEFDDELESLNEQMISQATEQARGILLAMTPPDAVDHLMQLQLQESVVLLKGMPEKDIAEILQEFLGGSADKDRIDRGREIFEAITRGEPTSSLLEAANQDFGVDAPNARR